MQIKKPTLKHIFYFAFFLWIIFLLWYARGYFFDEAPDAGRDDFYANSERQISDETNTAVGISGLDAPIDANSLKYGRAAMNTYFLDYKTPKPTNDTLKFISINKEDAVDCKLPDAVEIETDICTKINEVGELIAKNNVMLKRYTNLYNMHNWQDEATGNGQNLITINRLLAAQTKLLILNKKYDEAFIIWHDNHIFISRVLGQENTMISRAIFLVLDGINLESLENLLYSSPETGAKYNSELSQLLKPQDLARYNIKNMLSGEYRFFNTYLLNTEESKKAIHVEYMRNRMYRFHLDFLNNAHKPENTLAASGRELYHKYNSSIPATFIRVFLPHGLSQTLANILINGQAKGFELVRSMHHKNALMSLLGLRVKIQQKNINANQIQVFLNNAGKEYNCPITEHPMIYDATKNTIYCENPEENARVAEVRL